MVVEPVSVLLLTGALVGWLAGVIVKDRSVGSHPKRKPRTAPMALSALAALVGASPSLAYAQSVAAAPPGDGFFKGENGGRLTPSRLPPAVVRPDAAKGLARPYGGTPISVTTFHYDNARTGWNPHETDLTPASVASGDFGLLATLPVDTGVWAQPLLVSGYAMPDGATHDVLIVVTTNNSVYAFDANTYAILWHVNLGPPETDRSPMCTGAKATGIDGTPAIGPGADGKKVIYLVTMLQPSSGVYDSQVRALDLGSGKDVKPAAHITASETLSNGLVVSFNPLLQYNRTGIALRDGNLYFGVAASCEPAADLTTGWVFRFGVNLALRQAYPMIQQQQSGQLLGGVWMSGFAPAVDGQGNVFVITGNGSTSLQSPQAWSNSVLKLAPDLSKVIDSFTPANYASLDPIVADFGSGGVVLLPKLPGVWRNPLAVAMGKDPTIYLLDQTALGGFSSTNSGAKQALTVGSGAPESGVWGGPAYYDGPAGPTIYYQTKNDNLKAYHLSGKGQPTLSLSAQGVSPLIANSSNPTVSSNGSLPKTGIVWVVKRTSPVTLEAYDAVKLGAPIYQSSAGQYVGLSQTAMVANGRVYVPAYGAGGVYVFGLVN